MPNAPKRHRHLPLKQLERRQPNRRRESRGWYNLKIWRGTYDAKTGKLKTPGLRHIQLEKEPLCEECRKNGWTVEAKDVDHIRPFADDRLTEPKQRELFLDSANLQSLCTSCHSKKTKREQAMERGQKRFIVCGLPGVGKSTWVREKARPGDFVWDVDAVAAVCFGMPNYPRPECVAKALGAMRAAALRTASTIDGDVFVIEAEQSKAEALQRDIGGEVIVLKCEEAERLARIRSRAGFGR